VAEIGFVVLVSITVLAITLSPRPVRDRQREGDRRLRAAAGESGVGLSSAATPEGVRSKFDDWFETAVRRSGLDASPAGVVAVMLLAATVLGSGLYFWKEQLWLAGLGVILGIVLPFAVVAYYHRQYRWQLQNQLPEAYRMLAGSVRAGQTLEQAVAFYGDRGSKPLADEFAHCAGLMRLGMGPAAALRSTGTRVRLLDFDLLISTVGLYTQTGGNLVLLLERLADSVRDRNQLMGQFAAATAQSRAVAIAIGSAAPMLLMYYALAEPEHVRAFFSSTTGWAVLACTAVLEVVGLVWIWQILKTDY